MSMIVMVCISVISTGFVMHISGLSQPMPRWVKRLFLDIIPRFLCLSVYSDVDLEQFGELSHNQVDKNDLIENGVELNDAAEEIETSVGILQKESSSRVAERSKCLKDDKAKWRRLSIIIDRMLLYLFSLFTIFCTTYLSIRMISGSAKEYDDILQDLDENWSDGVRHIIS